MASRQRKAAQETIRIAAFGDSVMWGQGLRREQRFSDLIAGKLRAETGRDAQLVWDMSRSGAEIRATEDQRRQHVDRYLYQFPNLKGMVPFLDGRNDSPAAQLYGEVPCTFPTVRGQVRLLPIAEGRTIDVALVDGGINDVAPEDIVNPQAFPGEWIEHWDGLLRSVGHGVVLSLLSDVRAKCPNALILYFGFFPTVSYVSNRGRLRDLAKYQKDNDFLWYLNKFVARTVDVNEFINEFQTRGEWLAGRWAYWTRQAVVDANRNSDIRGPGVLYAPSGFKPENAALTKTSFLHDDWEPPTSDPARDKRIAETPRQDQLGRLVRLYGETVIALTLDRLGQGEVDRLSQDVRPRINGPAALIKAVNDLAHVRRSQPSDGEVRRALTELLTRLESEIKTIQRSTIASLAHPNAAGARSYASHAMARYVRHRQTLARIDRERANPPAGGDSLDATLRRYGLRTSLQIEADVGNLDVDSLAVRVVTAANSDRHLRESVWLVVDTADDSGAKDQYRYMLNFRYYPKFNSFIPDLVNPLNKPYPHFEPEATNRLTVDTAGEIRLQHIAGVRLVMGADPLAGIPGMKDVRARTGTVWRPATVELEVNGQNVRRLELSGREFKPGEVLDFQYPTQSPLDKVPVLTVAKIDQVSRFGQLTD